MSATDYVAKTDESDLKLLTLANAPKGSVGEVFRFVIPNVGTQQMTNIRLAAEYANGRFDVDEGVDGYVEDVNLLGKEAVDERWLEVRCIGIDVAVDVASPSEGSVPFKPVGGPYGLNEDDTEMDVDAWLPVPDLDPGSKAVCEGRIRVPADAATQRQCSWMLAVSFEGGEED